MDNKQNESNKKRIDTIREGLEKKIYRQMELLNEQGIISDNTEEMTDHLAKILEDTDEDFVKNLDTLEILSEDEVKVKIEDDFIMEKYNNYLHTDKKESESMQKGNEDNSEIPNKEMVSGETIQFIQELSNRENASTEELISEELDKHEKIVHEEIIIEEIPQENNAEEEVQTNVELKKEQNNLSDLEEKTETIETEENKEEKKTKVSEEEIKIINHEQIVVSSEEEETQKIDTNDLDEIVTNNEDIKSDGKDAHKQEQTESEINETSKETRIEDGGIEQEEKNEGEKENDKKIAKEKKGFDFLTVILIFVILVLTYLIYKLIS